MTFSDEIQSLENILREQMEIWLSVPGSWPKIHEIDCFENRLDKILCLKAEKQKQEFFREFPSVQHGKISSLFLTPSAKDLEKTQQRHKTFLKQFEFSWEQAKDSCNSIPEAQVPSLSSFFFARFRRGFARLN